jgi:hypothetical protein
MSNPVVERKQSKPPLTEPHAGRGARIGSLNMQTKFKNYDDFEKYAREQDRWIYDNQQSLPEHNINGFRLEKFDKYAAEKQVEYIVMSSSEGIPNYVNVFYHQGNQSHQIWSGHVNSPNEYQAMMVVVNKFIEEYKNNSGALNDQKKIHQQKIPRRPRKESPCLRRRDGD